MGKELQKFEREALRYEERYLRDRNQPSFATYRQDKLDDKLTREAALKLSRLATCFWRGKVRSPPHKDPTGTRTQGCYATDCRNAP